VLRAEVILRFLNLNSGDEAESYWQGVWKVLLYDDYCRDILAPLLKVGELRKQGITLHLYHITTTTFNHDSLSLSPSTHSSACRVVSCAVCAVCACRVVCRATVRCMEIGRRFPTCRRSTL